jgi:hypothetical protein
MLDGALKFRCQFLAVILFAAGRVHFLDLFDLPNQTSKTISSRVAPVIQSLAQKNWVVTAVCTDNASNEKAILNAEHDYSLQELTGLPIVRLSCIAHTVNLALSDFLHNPLHKILDALQKVLQALPRGARSQFTSVPRINETRWLSCREVVMYLVQHAPEIEAYFQRAGLREMRWRLLMLKLPDLAQILNIFSNLILRVEGNSNVYSDVFPAYADALHLLGQLPMTDVRNLASYCLKKRFTETANFSHIVATYVLSPQGHNHLQQFPRFSSYVNSVVVWAKQGLLQLCEIFRISTEHVLELFEFYLWSMPVDCPSAGEFWATFPRYLPLQPTTD